MNSGNAYATAKATIPWDQSFSTKKEVATEDAKTDISAMTLDALKEKEFTYTISDPVGIHARPAGMLAKKSKKFKIMC